MIENNIVGIKGIKINIVNKKVYILKCKITISITAKQKS